jgi:hypothetical protein
VEIRSRAHQKRKEKENPGSSSLALLQGQRDTDTLSNISSETPFQRLINTGKTNNDRALALSLLYSLTERITSRVGYYPPRID